MRDRLLPDGFAVGPPTPGFIAWLNYRNCRKLWTVGSGSPSPTIYVARPYRILEVNSGLKSVTCVLCVSRLNSMREMAKYVTVKKRRQRTFKTCASKSFAIDVSFGSRPNTARSLLRLAAIQCFECKQDPADLSRKGRFIAAQAIKREAGQISQP